MKKENEIVIISGFIGFTIGVCSMMFVNIDKEENCFGLIEEIEHQVCEECWNSVFDHGEKYEEVQYYVNGE